MLVYILDRYILSLIANQFNMKKNIKNLNVEDWGGSYVPVKDHSVAVGVWFGIIIGSAITLLLVHFLIVAPLLNTIN